jgi:hypothetical protein
LPLGMPKPRRIPAALRVATIRSALFMGIFAWGTVGRGEISPPYITRFALDRGCRCAYKVAQGNGKWQPKCEILLRDWYR